MDQPPLDSTFGIFFVGVILGAILYGVLCAQVFYYFEHYSKKDGLGIKAIVVASLICDTIHQALISHTIYTYVIAYYFQPQKLGTILWSPVISILFSAIVALLVQIFYAIRIWKFSQRNVIIVATLSIFIAGQFVSSIIYVAKVINMTMLAELAEVKSLSIFLYVTGATGDVLITIVFCALLRGTRTNLQRSNTMINLLIAFSVQTGMLTSLCAVAAVIFIIASPHTFIYMCFYFLLGRLYCNSLMATLNVRDSIRERGDASLGISLRPIDDSNSSSVANPKAEVPDVGTHGYITGVKSHDGDDISPSVPPMSRTDNSQAIWTDSEVDSGRAS